MLISILPPSRSRSVSFDTIFALQQDEWNDYNFQTQYHLHYRGPNGLDTPALIGAVKILKKGQTGSDGLLIQQPFDQLAPDFCSVGARLDYYGRLWDMVDGDRQFILRALNDVVRFPGLQNQFRDEAGWQTSLFRDNPNPNEFIADATATLSGDYANLADLDKELKFTPGGWNTSLALDFDAPEPFEPNPGAKGFAPIRRRIPLPRRIIVLIGRNGSGKSTLLSRIARVAHASPSERGTGEIREIGSFDPPRVAFSRIVAISYSAFDSFIVPGISKSELAQLASDVDRGAGRYVFAGLRDVAQEAREDIEGHDNAQAGLPHPDLLPTADRRSRTKLKQLSELGEEFGRLLVTIRQNGDAEMLEEALSPILLDPSFSDLDSRSVEELVGDDPRVTFHGWSTGHKIVMHVIASLVANTRHKSLVLFDEPETHLHPPLVAALMHAIRIVLEKKNALALVATHSPVVLQETLARHVRVVRRVGNDFEVRSPQLETFGENVGILTYDTFRLTAETTDFHNVLDRLIAAYDSVDEINEFFTPALSSQALAYVMTGLARKSRRA